MFQRYKNLNFNLNDKKEVCFFTAVRSDYWFFLKDIGVLNIFYGVFAYFNSYAYSEYYVAFFIFLSFFFFIRGVIDRVSELSSIKVYSRFHSYLKYEMKFTTLFKIVSFISFLVFLMISNLILLLLGYIVGSTFFFVTLCLPIIWTPSCNKLTRNFYGNSGLIVKFFICLQCLLMLFLATCFQIVFRNGGANFTNISNALAEIFRLWWPVFLKQILIFQVFIVIGFFLAICLVFLLMWLLLKSVRFVLRSIISSFKSFYRWFTSFQSVKPSALSVENYFTCKYTNFSKNFDNLLSYVFNLGFIIFFLFFIVFTFASLAFSWIFLLFLKFYGIPFFIILNIIFTVLYKRIYSFLGSLNSIKFKKESLAPLPAVLVSGNRKADREMAAAMHDLVEARDKPWTVSAIINESRNALISANENAALARVKVGKISSSLESVKISCTDQEEIVTGIRNELNNSETEEAEIFKIVREKSKKLEDLRIIKSDVVSRANKLLESLNWEVNSPGYHQAVKDIFGEDGDYGPEIRNLEDAIADLEASNKSAAESMSKISLYKKALNERLEHASRGLQVLHEERLSLDRQKELTDDLSRGADGDATAAEQRFNRLLSYCPEYKQVLAKRESSLRSAVQHAESMRSITNSEAIARAGSSSHHLQNGADNLVLPVCSKHLSDVQHYVDLFKGLYTTSCFAFFFFSAFGAATLLLDIEGFADWGASALFGVGGVSFMAISDDIGTAIISETVLDPGDCTDCKLSHSKALKGVNALDPALLAEYNELYAKNLEKAKARGEVVNNDLRAKIHSETIAEIELRNRGKAVVIFGFLWLVIGGVLYYILKSRSD